MGLVSICKDITFLMAATSSDHLKKTTAKLNLFFQFKRYVDLGKKRPVWGREIKYVMTGTIGIKDNSLKGS